MKRKLKQFFRKRHDKQKLDPTLLEKMNRNNPEDKIEIGTIVENSLNGGFGTVLNLLINGLIDDDLDLSRTDHTRNADRTLGGIESLHKLQDRLDMCIEQKKNMQEIIQEESSVSDAEPIEDEVGPQAV